MFHHGDVENERPNTEQWKPLEVTNNFEHWVDGRVFTSPFASEVEARGFLSGSEHNVLCSREESIFSHDFVQCAGALIRNRKTGVVFVIHESTWSSAADAILYSQKPDDLDVIKIGGPISQLMEFETIKKRHINDVSGAHKNFDAIDRKDKITYGDKEPKMINMRHVFPGGSSIRGLTIDEMENMLNKADESKTAGKTKLVGEIEIPVKREESSKWSLLYRPTENIIWIYSGAHKLFKYPGFPR